MSFEDLVQCFNLTLQYRNPIPINEDHAARELTRVALLTRVTNLYDVPNTPQAKVLISALSRCKYRALSMSNVACHLEHW